MGITEAAIARLKQQRDEDAKTWRLGKQLTDAQLLCGYIHKLEVELDLARDDAFLARQNY